MLRSGLPNEPKKHLTRQSALRLPSIVGWPPQCLIALLRKLHVKTSDRHLSIPSATVDVTDEREATLPNRTGQIIGLGLASQIAKCRPVTHTEGDPRPVLGRAAVRRNRALQRINDPTSGTEQSSKTILRSAASPRPSGWVCDGSTGDRLGGPAGRLFPLSVQLNEWLTGKIR
jgi:hypothetical protein